MANKNLFKSGKTVKTVKNKAGGTAYDPGVKHSLAQFAATGCMGSTFYASAESQLKELQDMIKKVDSEFLGKLAIYSRQSAYMKDMPAYILAELAARNENEIINKVFDQVVDNMKMLRNFVQIIRSGVTGRKSFGSFLKRKIQNWLESKSNDELLKSSVGQSPSLADIIKMVHPKPASKKRCEFYNYMLGRPADLNAIGGLVREFENFKQEHTGLPPDVPFQMLSNIKLSVSQWKDLVMNMSWHTLRMNLNTITRNGVWDGKMDKLVANKLVQLPKKVFPYQIMTTYLNINDVPVEVSNALQDALELATKNIEPLNLNMAVCIDVSGSMHSPVTGYGSGKPTVTQCTHVAALIAACYLRTNQLTTVVPFHTRVEKVNLNPRDSVLTNANILSRLPSGGTDCSAPLQYLTYRTDLDLVVMVSDNESWFNNNNYRSSHTKAAWEALKKKNPKCKLVCIDVVPNSTVQVLDDKSVLNIGGFSDNVFTVINDFVKGDPTKFVNTIEQIQL